MSLAGWDSGRVAVSNNSLSLDLTNENSGWGSLNEAAPTSNMDLSVHEAKQRFLTFLRNFQIDKTFIYRYGII
jgi:hypothetical protein